MVTQDEIEQQVRLLEAYRSTLFIYLEQRAKLGAAFTPPGIINGIVDTQREIRRIKPILREWGQTVGDHPNDEAELFSKEQQDDKKTIPINPLIPAIVIDVLSGIGSHEVKERWSAFFNPSRYPALDYSNSHRSINAVTYNKILQIIDEGAEERSKWVRADYNTIAQFGFDKKKYRDALIRDDAEMKSWNIAKDILTENERLFINNIEEFKATFNREFRIRVLQNATSSLHELDDTRLHDFVHDVVSLYYIIFNFDITP